MLNPGSRAQRIQRIACQVALLDGLRILHHLPSITRQIGPVDDEHADRTATRSLLVLVGPAAVVGHRLALEKLLILRGRLIHDHQRNLALQIHARVVVPVVLGRVDAVAHKHNRRIEISSGLPGLILRNNLAAIGKIDRRTARRHERKLRLVFDGVHRDQRHFLEVAPVIARRL